jgi:hypothetical protein
VTRSSARRATTARRDSSASRSWSRGWCRPAERSSVSDVCRRTNTLLQDAGSLAIGGQEETNDGEQVVQLVDEEAGRRLLPQRQHPQPLRRWVRRLPRTPGDRDCGHSEDVLGVAGEADRPAPGV